MAESSSAIALSFALTNEGWNVNFDKEVFHQVWQSRIRSWKKRSTRFQARIRNDVYPAHFSSLFILIAIVIGVHFSGYKVPYDLLNKFVVHIPGRSLALELLTCTLSSFAAWTIGVYTIRCILKGLFMYKGWMYEEKGKGNIVSMPTKFWSLAVTVLQAWNKPGLYSFQGTLPRLPLPSLNDTVQRYLRSVRPLLKDDDYERTVKLASEFEKGAGVKLQRYLWFKSWWSTNYVSDWWEEYAYLRCRAPMMINSNFYENDGFYLHPTSNQAARAGFLINLALRFRRLIERQELKPILIQGLVPLCSRQYERLFNTTRIPGIEVDQICHWPDSDHIVVYHKGRYFKVVIYKGRILKPCEIQIQIQQILDDKSAPLPGEERLAALTGAERTHWAKCRQNFFIKGINKQSLDLIEKAAFCVTLDDVPYTYDENKDTKFDDYSKILFHGKGYDRWFDKSFNICVGSNGRFGYNSEHSWGDAALIGHVGEYILVTEASEGYEQDGNCRGTPELTPPPPIHLQWDINSECQAFIDVALQTAHNLIADIELHVLIHKQYGKGFIKTCGISPDGYIQMALQLAYYRDTGKFSLTYEASMTRLYCEGRTETVRPCSIESAAWVKAMEDKNVKCVERIELLQIACKRHQSAYQDAMCGKGIDRHLFCLYIISKYLQLDSPFLNDALKEPWRLSTSQTPHGQTNLLNLKKHPEYISAGGGFAPVVEDGYGISYIIAGEDLIFFHVSNKPSCLKTDSHRMTKNIERALDDMKKLFEEYRQSNGTK